MQRATFPGETLPVRMRREQRIENAIQDFATSVQRAEFHVAPRGHNLERRRERCEVPPGITLGVFVAGGKIYAALRVELAQQPVQSAAVRQPGNTARYRDTTGGRITFGAHTTTEGWALSRISLSLPSQQEIAAGTVLKNVTAFDFAGSERAIPARGKF